MATYLDARKAINHNSIKRFIYICGPSVTLQERLVDAIKSYVSASDYDYASLSVGDSSLADIWAAMNQFHYQRVQMPFKPAVEQPKRLIVVRETQKISDWTEVVDWLDHAVAKRQLPNVYVVFLSTDDAWPTDHEPEVRERIMKAGTYVRCAPPKEAQAPALLVHESVEKLTDKTAQYLWSFVGGNLEEALSCIDKAKFFNGTLGEKTIRILATPNLADSFIDYMMRGHKEPAYALASRMPPSEIRGVIGALAYNLEACHKLYAAIQASGGDYRTTVLKARLPNSVVNQLMPVARSYTGAYYRRKIEALTFADAAVHKGTTNNVLELLITLW